MSKKRTSSSKGEEPTAKSLFVPLMDGSEGEGSVRGRERLFEECWSHVETRIKVHFELGMGVGRELGAMC